MLLFLFISSLFPHILFEICLFVPQFKVLNEHNLMLFGLLMRSALPCVRVHNAGVDNVAVIRLVDAGVISTLLTVHRQPSDRCVH